MLDFITFLSAKEKDILDLIYKAQYSVEENTPLCLLGDKFFGFLKKRTKTVVICTENAKEYGGYNFIMLKSFVDPRRLSFLRWIVRGINRKTDSI